MPRRTAYFYAAIAIAFAVAFGLSVGPYWVDDAITLAIMVFLAIMVCLSSGQAMKILTSWWVPAPRIIRSGPVSRAPILETGYRHVPRSKIAHFVTLSRIEFKSATALDSYNTFERALLGKKGWQEIPADELKALAETRQAQ